MLKANKIMIKEKKTTRYIKIFPNYLVQNMLLEMALTQLAEVCFKYRYSEKIVINYHQFKFKEALEKPASELS